MLKEIDYLNWTQGHGNRFTHDWFKFPGKFHPPLVEHILRSLKPVAVVDPMAGVGTVAVEAKAAGIPSLSLDVDPVSMFFAKVKTTPISSQVLQEAWSDLSESLKKFRRSEEEIELRMFRDIRKDAMRETFSRLEASDLERLTYWFRRYVLVDFARVDHAIWNGGLPSRSKTVRRFFLACLLSSIRRISLADPTPVSGLEITKHMRERIQDGYRIDVFAEFERRVGLAICRMAQYTAYMQEKGTQHTPAHCVQADCADLSSVKTAGELGADLVLFSPPYCNAIEYWRRHRLEYFLGRFLDEDGAADLHHQSIGRTTLGETAKEIPPFGFRPIDEVLTTLNGQERSRKARILWQYFAEMKRRLEVFRNYLPDDGHCVIVVGDSTTNGMRIPTSRTLAWIGEQVGFSHIKTSRYKIKNRVMQFPVKSNEKKIDREAIIVLKRE